MMPDLPLQGRFYRYTGRDERKRRAIAEKNLFVSEAARRANQIIADRPYEIQQISFALIASDIGCDVEIVRRALGDGGYNGRTFRVTQEDRAALEPYRTKVE